MWIKFIPVSEISKSNFFYFSHFKFVSHFGNYIQNGLLYPIWALGPNLFNDFFFRSAFGLWGFERTGKPWSPSIDSNNQLYIVL